MTPISKTYETKQPLLWWEASRDFCFVLNAVQANLRGALAPERRLQEDRLAPR